MSRTDVTVRPVEPSDLEPIVAIDERLSGKSRKAYWHTRLDIAALRPPWMATVAETDGRVAGFLFGWVGESEFGVGVPTAWIDLIGVDPAYRGRRVAAALVDRFAANARQLRAVEKLATLIDLGQESVREFFLHQGFRHGPLVHMECPADRR
jgi:GNAT superfamily N-acetyltransferase